MMILSALGLFLLVFGFYLRGYRLGQKDSQCNCNRDRSHSLASTQGSTVNNK